MTTTLTCPRAAAALLASLLALATLTACDDTRQTGNTPEHPTDHPDTDQNEPNTSSQTTTTPDFASRIQTSEYAIRARVDDFAAVNRQHGLRARWQHDRILLTPRTTTDTLPPVTLKLGAWGCAGLTRPAAPARIALGPCQADGATDLDGTCLHRLDLRRNGLVEWWENSPRGFEHGFDILEPPDGQPCKLELQLEVEGANVEPTVDGARLLRDAGPGLTYTHLRAWDANGKPLLARLENAPTLTLLVDASEAAFPIHVDPVMATSPWRVIGPAGQAWGGYVQAIGDVNGDGYDDLAYSFNGTVYSSNVHLGSPTGPTTAPVWSAPGSVTRAGDVNGDGMDEVLVFTGSAIDIFPGTPQGPSPTAVWTIDPRTLGGNLNITAGGDVNGDGFADLLLGLTGFENGQIREGQLALFYGGPAWPASAPDWRYESNQAEASLGVSVLNTTDIDGDGFDDVIAGAQGFDAGQTDEGRVFIFRGSANGPPSSPSWTRETNVANQRLGGRLAGGADLNGDGIEDLLVKTNDTSEVLLYTGGTNGPSSSPVWRLGGTSGSLQVYEFETLLNPAGDGQAHIVVRRGSGRVQTFPTNTSGPASTPRLDLAWVGAMASAGDVDGDGLTDLLLGNSAADEEGRTNSGLVTLLHGTRTGTTHPLLGHLPGPDQDAAFATVVAPAGDVNGDGYGDVLVGAPSFDNGQAEEGRAFLWLGTRDGLAASPSWIQEGDLANARFGAAVQGVGDVDGDGFGDVVVGSPGHSGSQAAEGLITLYRGSAAGLSSNPAWTAVGGQAGARLGSAVAAAGDVNGDGRADLLVGAPEHDTLAPNGGRAYLYLGAAQGALQAPAWTLDGTEADAHLGAALAGAGDVNGDGLSDLVVGAPDVSAGLTRRGRVMLVHGATDPAAMTTSWSREGTVASQRYGARLATVGDVNGDGRADVLIADAAAPATVQLFLGAPTGLAATPDWSTPGTVPAGLGDFNGDGYADFAIGTPDFAEAGLQLGKASVFFGSSAGPRGVSLDFTGTWDGAGFGCSVASAGDLDGDGLADAIVGSCGTSAAGQGAALVLRGRPEAPGALPAATFPPTPTTTDDFGAVLAPAGDVNGDGFDDVLIGAAAASNGQSSEGRAFVYLGTAAGLDPVPVWIGEGDQASARYGNALSGLGDLNGDGYDDIGLAAYAFDTDLSNVGMVFVYNGSPAGPASAADWTRAGTQANEYLGGASQGLAGAGDVNGDGFMDVIIGAHGHDNGQVDEGKASLFLGSANGLGVEPAWTAEPDRSAAAFGRVVAGVGDLNGDGYADVAVAAPDFDVLGTDEGRVFVYLGSPSGPSPTADATFSGDRANQRLGAVFLGATDLDGDGRTDAAFGSASHADVLLIRFDGQRLVGTTLPNGLNTPTATALVDPTRQTADLLALSRTTTTAAALLNLATTPGEQLTLPAATRRASLTTPTTYVIPKSLSLNLDPNADGWPDLLVGHAGRIVDLGTAERSATSLFLNNGLDATHSGRPVLARARAVATDQLLAPGGRSNRANAFDVTLRAFAPDGRARARLLLEVVPHGQSFEAPQRYSSPGWVDTGLESVTLRVTANGLAPDTAYRWRARLLYDPAQAPRQTASRWFYGGSTGHPTDPHLRTGANAPPTLSLPDPIAVNEGEAVDLTATATDPEGLPLTIAWDLNDDGNFDDAAGPTARITAADGPATLRVGAQASDGAQTVTAYTQLDVQNVAPTLPRTPPGLATEGSLYEHLVDAQDVLADTLTYTRDAGPDGLTLSTDGWLRWTPSAAQARLQPPEFTVVITITDDDGGALQTSWSITVAAAGCDDGGAPDACEILYDFDPCDPSDDLLDPDLDGLTTAEECQRGTDPRVSNAPGAPTPLAPLDGALVQTPAAALQVANAVDPDGDPLRYAFELYDASNALAWSLDDIAQTPVTTQVSVPTAATTEDQLRCWRARATDGRAVGPWSPLQCFRFSATNDAPSTPSPVGPIGSTNRLTPALTVTNAVDPEGEVLTYAFALVDESSNPVASTESVPEQPNRTTWQPDVTLDPTTTYSWRARASDPHGLWSPWSDPVAFTINLANSPPLAPALVAPALGGKAAPTDLELVVTEAVDPDGDLRTYTFSASNDPLRADADTVSDVAPRGDDEVAIAVTADAFPALDLSEDARIHWTASANDGVATGPPAEGWFILSDHNDPPGAPLLTAPPDGAALDTHPASFSWTNATDPDDSDLTATIELYANTMAGEPLWTTTVTQSSDSTTTVSPPEDLLVPPGSLTWRVQAHDPDGDAGPWSDSFRFELLDTTPELLTPAPISPPDLAELPGPDVVLTWDAPPTDGLTFDVLVANANGSLYAQHDALNSTTLTLADVPTGAYEWSVKAHLGALHGDWSQPWRFVVSEATSDDAPDNADPYPERRVETTFGCGVPARGAPLPGGWGWPLWLGLTAASLATRRLRRHPPANPLT